jgi:hypothetical protein
MNPLDELDDAVWQHALHLADPAASGRLTEAAAVVQALLSAAGRLAELADMPPRAFAAHQMAALVRLMTGHDLRDEADHDRS